MGQRVSHADFADDADFSLNKCVSPNFSVIRLDMSRAGAEPESIRSYLDYTFQEYESLYEIEVNNNSSLATRLSEIVRIAYEQTGQQVVILIDEYDSPLQRSWKTPLYEKCTAIYRDVFAILKSMDKFENFIFITACTKFSQFSLTSGLNNLSFIGFDSEYDTLCGITKEEAIRYFKPEINKLAACKGWTFDEAVMQLSSYYGGYHFSSRNKVEVFNPFCLLGFPNSEVKRSLYETILPALTSEAEQQRRCGCSRGADESQAVCRAFQG